jgi:hypothetical protein
MARRSALPLTLVAALFACCANRAAFLLGPRPAPGRGSSAVARQVNIFEGFSLPDTQGNEPSGESSWDGARSAREADDSGGRIVECGMPLGVEFEERGKGDIYVKAVDESSDAWSQGVRPGAQLTFISATFGDEMWNTKGVGMTQFMTVLKSRFGSTISLKLEKEKQDFLQGFFAALQPKKDAEAEKNKKSQEELIAEFEAGEKDLEGKSFWNPFR